MVHAIMHNKLAVCCHHERGHFGHFKSVRKLGSLFSLRVMSMDMGFRWGPKTKNILNKLKLWNSHGIRYLPSSKYFQEFHPFVKKIYICSILGNRKLNKQRTHLYQLSFPVMFVLKQKNMEKKVWSFYTQPPTRTNFYRIWLDSEKKFLG